MTSKPGKILLLQPNYRIICVQWLSRMRKSTFDSKLQSQAIWLTSPTAALLTSQPCEKNIRAGLSDTFSML